MLEQPQQNEDHCGASTCAVRGLSRAVRFSGDLAVLLLQLGPAHVANIEKQLGVSLTEARQAVRTRRILACLAGTSSIQVIARQQLGVVTFIVFSVSSK